MVALENLAFFSHSCRCVLNDSFDRMRELYTSYVFGVAQWCFREGVGCTLSVETQSTAPRRKTRVFSQQRRICEENISTLAAKDRRQDDANAESTTFADSAA